MSVKQKRSYCVVYHLCCDRCQEHGNGAFSRREAAKRCADEGWWVKSVVLCPDCLKAEREPTKDAEPQS